MSTIYGLGPADLTGQHPEPEPMSVMTPSDGDLPPAAGPPSRDYRAEQLLQTCGQAVEHRPDPGLVAQRLICPLQLGEIRRRRWAQWFGGVVDHPDTLRPGPNPPSTFGRRHARPRRGRRLALRPGDTLL